MLKILIKSKLASLIDALSYGGGKKRKKKLSKAGFIALFSFIAIASMVSLGSFFWLLCNGAQAGVMEPWTVFGMAVSYAFLFCIIGSVFAVKVLIFESKDNDLLLSMPIPTKYIFISRMIVLFVINFALESLVFIPCTILYAVMIGFSFQGVINLILVSLLLPFLVLTLSTLVAWLISEITSRVKHKNIVTIVLYLAILISYFVFTMTTSANGAMVSTDIYKKTFIFWWSASAITSGNFLSLLWFSLISLIPAIITFVLLDKAFIRIITTSKSANKKKYTGNHAKSSSTYFALLKKELLKFFTSPSYIMNAGIGSIMCVILSIYIATMSGKILPIVDVPGFEWTANLFAPAIVVICAFIGGMSFVSAPSISLEDKQLWILHSCPINPKDILMAKLSCHIIVCAPLTLISAVILCIAYKINIGMSILVFLTVFVCVLFCDYIGLFFGLKFPKFGWQNEMVPIKQSLSTFVSMLGSMVFFAGLGFASYHLSKVSGYLAILIIFSLCATICGIVHTYLISSGVKDFDNLKK